jgi:2'-5' RNA ligase
MVRSVIRAFAALPLPAPQREALAAHLIRCARLAPGFRWVPASNLHLTLRFAGNLEGGVADRLREALRQVACAPFQLRLGDVGHFGGRRAGVIWLALAEGQERAAELARQCEAVCRQVGLAPEERPFRPHVTLARPRDRRGELPPELPPPPELDPWIAREFVLYRSRLGGGPPVYEPLEVYALEA